MIGKTERVILVKGDTTKWYEQAIFIVNTNAQAEQIPLDFVAEAEKIIDEYNLKRENKKAASVIITPPSKPSIKGKATFMLGFLMVLASLAVAAIFTFGLMN